MVNKLFFKVRILVVLLVLVSSTYANVAFQYGWDKGHLSTGNIYNKNNLTTFLQTAHCSDVAFYSSNPDLSAVVVKGLHSENSSNKRKYYTIRLYNCPTSQLSHVGDMLKCSNYLYNGTFYLLENAQCYYTMNTIIL